MLNRCSKYLLLFYFVLLFDSRGDVMNFLWCGVNYVGNEMFNFVPRVVGIGLIILFVPLYVKIYNAKLKKIKNIFLKYLLSGLLIFLFMFLWMLILAILLAVASSWKIENGDKDWCMGCFKSGYTDYKDFYKFSYIVMSVILLLNFAWIYYCFIYKIIIDRKNKTKNKKDKEKKKRSCILIYVLINIFLIGSFVGFYYWLDNKAPDYDIYETQC